MFVVATGAARLYTRQDDITAAARRELEHDSPRWSGRIMAWQLGSRFAVYSPASRVGENAAVVLWPHGIDGAGPDCPLFVALGPNWPGWRDTRGAWLPSATCADLETFAAAGRHLSLDLSALAQGPGFELLYGYGQRARVRNGLHALIASAWLEREQNNLSKAEERLRSAVGLALLLIGHDPTQYGLEIGHRGLVVALHHLEALYEQRAIGSAAQAVSRLRAELPPFEDCRGLLAEGFPRAGSIEEGVGVMTEVAKGGDLPLAIRVRAAYWVRNGRLGTPAGLLLPPTPARSAAIRDLSRDPDLKPWIRVIEAMRPASWQERTRTAIEWAVVR